MNPPPFIINTIRWILYGIQLQLFITLFSLPLLCAWGLPLSLLSPLGNLLFGPVLTIFLFLSSFIFLTELIGISNGYLITILEQLTFYWLLFMHADTQRWLIGFVQPSYYILLLLPAGAIVIMICNQTRSLYRSIICLTLLFSLFWGYTNYLQHSVSSCISIPCNNGAVHCICHDGNLTLIDPGYLGKTIGAPSWVQFTLVPYIIQKTGCTTLDHVIVLQPNATTLKAIESLMLKMHVGSLYLPYWNGSLSRLGLQSYHELKKLCLEKHTQLIRFGNYTKQISQAITIEPLSHTIHTASISYPAFAIRMLIDNQNVTLYSAKYPHLLTSKQCAYAHQGTRVSDGH